jgi:hypothetical protein
LCSLRIPTVIQYVICLRQCNCSIKITSHTYRTTHNPPPPQLLVKPACVIPSWRIFSAALTVCYSMLQIRHHSTYPQLTHDQRQDLGESQGAKCSKYYSQYDEQHQTGGIMCAWCMHNICYEFHCILKGEGQNDVFPVMLTRWQKPPKHVIYDFSCALGPYYMLYELDFFADTQFLIDVFHATGHTSVCLQPFFKIMQQ